MHRFSRFANRFTTVRFCNVKQIPKRVSCVFRCFQAFVITRVSNFKNLEPKLRASQNTRNITPILENASHAIFTYHKSWSYLADAFGLDVVATVEPVPGIPPTARHLAELVDAAKARKVGVLIQEPYFSADAGKFLTRSAALRVVTISSSCDGPEAGSYLTHVQAVLAALVGGK